MNQSNQHPWLNDLLESSQLKVITRQLASSKVQRFVAHGSQGSSAALVSGATALQGNRHVLMVVGHLDDADNAVEDLELWQQAGHDLEIRRFGALEVLPGESSVSLELLAERLALVHEFSDPATNYAKPMVIVAPVQALMQSVPIPSAIPEMAMTLKVGQEMSPGNLATWLTDAGYSRVEGIEQPGEFAVRGGIVDIYPPMGANQDPVRLDYFGDEIDSICMVDPDTMGSGKRLESVQFIGAKLDQLQSDQATTSLWELMPRDTAVVLHEVMELSEQARGYYERLTNPVGIYAPSTVFASLIKFPHVEMNQYSSTSGTETAVTLPIASLTPFSENASTAVKELGERSDDPKAKLVIVCPKPAEKDRLIELIEQHIPGSMDRLTIEVGYLYRGFTWENDQGQTLILTPHQEIFHRYEVRRTIRRLSGSQSAGSRATDAFLDLTPGDYVVHIDHGIALFRGLRQMVPGSRKTPEGLPQPTKKKKTEKSAPTEEYLTLEFADKALLHVPATQIDMVSKYIGGFEGRPPLSKLGGKRWEKQKEQVEDAVKDMASELLRVQAARQAIPGIRFPEDTKWQKEFEAEFPYQETEDQLTAIHSCKQDMMSPRPMDRLICGDVGFGKTEVAIRAAFKAADAGKQVAVLVPTTVLAEQHERTFRKRMADYPINIECINRFKTGKQAKAIITGLATKSVDIVIGTHRLLSKDIRFADLGLVIIDEEQRFGVEHKNKLLQFRLTADVLTLSATPIPRTLHMSMLGLRDISSLSIPPADRRAIVTEVIAYNEHRIKNAIIREMNRNGQVYYVHNRVHDIQCVADNVKRLVPDARVIIGHGQMAGHELERVMLKFIRKQADVLVSTTIIESGIDIPTANTMIIDQADIFGLAELHQLRGRVGRYKHRAYCYLMLPEDRPVNDKAVKRLRAIEQYAMLGAGFKIAMRDLEIRGAGNLLGAEQSGHIAAVGYDMYCQMLEHATKRLRHERIIEPAKTHLELPAIGQLPKAYISSDKFRMEAYRRLSRALSMDEYDAVVKDITDAYGKAPAPAQTYMDLTELRLAATLLQIDVLKLEGPDLIFKTKAPQEVFKVFEGAPGRVSLIDETTVYYRPPSNYLEPVSTLLAVLRKLLVRPARDLDF
ncbi:MAG: transcription-repair coupling factor [Phycisphaeraceae bacterium]|nr:transcription-repair coupling factor [Phycisphaeraceae bacterium]